MGPLLLLGPGTVTLGRDLTFTDSDLSAKAPSRTLSPESCQWSGHQSPQANIGSS
jgi:hypothetical protein